MLVQHIALVPAAVSIEAPALARVAAALQQQVLRDLAPHWQILGGVSAFPSLEDVPLGYWPILITGPELSWGAGVHLDENGQPYAQVEHAPHWSLEASRACLEMLVNPLGDRTITTQSPRADQGLVQMLIEVCAGCSDAASAYAIDGVLVADFHTPAFFVRDAATPAHGYSFRGTNRAPLTLASAGHLTWFEVDSHSWWMRVQRGTQHDDTRLGPLDRPFMCVRELVSRQRKSGAAGLDAELTLRARQLREQAEYAARARARRLRALVGLPLEAQAPTPGLALAEKTQRPTLLVEPGYEPVHDEELELELELEVAEPASTVAEPVPQPSAVAPVSVAQELAGPTAQSELEPSASKPTLPPVLEAVEPAPALKAEPESTPQVAPETRPQGGARAAIRPPPARQAAQRNTPVSGVKGRGVHQPHTATSSVAPPSFLAEPPPRSSGFRDARLLAVAAALGVGFFALVSRERGAPAHARPQAPQTQPVSSHAAHATKPATSAATLAPPSLTQLPAPAGEPPAAKPDAGSAANQAVAGHAAQDSKRSPSDHTARRRSPKQTDTAPRPSSAPAVAPEPAIEDLFETRR
jgi:hypothetical protein